MGILTGMRLFKGSGKDADKINLSWPGGWAGISFYGEKADRKGAAYDLAEAIRKAAAGLEVPLMVGIDRVVDATVDAKGSTVLWRFDMMVAWPDLSDVSTIVKALVNAAHMNVSGIGGIYIDGMNFSSFNDVQECFAQCQKCWRCNTNKKPSSALLLAMRTRNWVKPEPTMTLVGALAGLSADGRRIVTAGTNEDRGQVYVWDASSGEKVTEFRVVNPALVDRVIISPNGKKVAVVQGHMSSVPVYDGETGKAKFLLNGHEKDSVAVIFSPDGRRLVTASNDKTARIWDSETGKELLVCRHHSAPVTCVTCTPDGKYAVSGGGRGDGSVRVWDIESGDQLKSYHIAEGDGIVRCIAISPDGLWMAISSTNPDKLQVWSTVSGKEVSRWCNNLVLSIDFSPDGRYLLTGGFNLTPRLWEARTGLLLLNLPVPLRSNNSIESVAFSPDGKNIMAASRYEHLVRVWKIEIDT